MTDSVVEELRAWQSRPLEPVYWVVYIDALQVKMRTQSGVPNRSVFIAMGVRCDGSKDVLGLWCNDTEGAKFWLSILTELKRRGVEDIWVLCSDGLTGIGQAVEATFPDAIFQTCIVHMIRSRTRFVPWKERKAVCKDLKRVYTADDAEQAALKLIYLAVTNALNKWGGPDRRSSGALLQFASHFEGRIPQ